MISCFTDPVEICPGGWPEDDLLDGLGWVRHRWERNVALTEAGIIASTWDHTLAVAAQQNRMVSHKHRSRPEDLVNDSEHILADHTDRPGLSPRQGEAALNR